MKVTLLANGKSPLELDVKDGMTLEELAKAQQDVIPVQPLGAIVGHEYMDLLQKVPDGETVRFFGLEYRPAIRIYEDSLSMLFVTALRRVFGPNQVAVQNSLNQGVYIELPSMTPVPETALGEIEIEMRTMIEEAIPFERVSMPREKALHILQEQGDYAQLCTLLEQAGEEELTLIRVGEMFHFPFWLTVPSADYLPVFELSVYHRGLLLRYPNCQEPRNLPAYRDQQTLYLAFAEQNKWEDITAVNFVSDLNEKVEEGWARELILLSEALHEKRVATIADEIRDSRKRLILVAGPSSSGKTTFARKLALQLRVNGFHPAYFSTDDYFLNREEMVPDANGEIDYEGLSAVDLNLFARNMNDLLAGKEVDIPVFDFLEGKKVFGKRMTKITGEEPIIIEGIHALNRKLTEQIPEEAKFRIYISPLTQINLDEHNRIPTTDERMLRRLVRDFRFRGYNASRTLELWPKVRDGEDVNIFPFSGEADATYNSYHIYEISVLKKYAEPILRQVKEDDPNYAEAQRVLSMLRWFRTIDDDTLVPNNSILREFIGGSVFVD